MDWKVGDVAYARFNDGSGGEKAFLTHAGWVGTRGPIRKVAEEVITFEPLEPGEDVLYWIELWKKASNAVLRLQGEATELRALLRVLLAERTGLPEDLAKTVAALRVEIGAPTENDHRWQPMVSAGELRALLDYVDPPQ